VCTVVMRARVVTDVVGLGVTQARGDRGGTARETRARDARAIVVDAAGGVGATGAQGDHR